MEAKINIAELLKDCPSGMELDCAIYENVTLIKVQEGYDYPIIIETPNGQMLFSKYGCFSKNELAKCVIFPKGKTTWEGFQRPFKDGDVIANNNYIAIFHKIGKPNNCISENIVYFHCWYSKKYNESKCKNDYGIGVNTEFKFATEEEKQTLFDVIKTKGYKWNEETKTLEELVPNKFDITTLKPFDKVLMRSSNAREWVATFYSHYSNNKFYGCGMCCDQCIPYEENQQLLGTTDDCDDYYKTWE